MVYALVELGNPRPLDLLIEVLKDKDEKPYAKDWAVNELVNIGSSAVDPLITLLEDEALDVKMYVVKALEKIDDPKVIDALIETLLNDKDTNVRESAVIALGRIGNSKVADALVDIALKDKNADIRRSTAKALGRIGDSKTIDHILSIALTGKPFSHKYNKEISYRAVMAVIHMRREETIPVLINALDTQGGRWVEVYLNCDYYPLSDAAKDWCKENGYKIYTELRPLKRR